MLPSLDSVVKCVGDIKNKEFSMKSMDYCNLKMYLAFASKKENASCWSQSNIKIFILSHHVIINDPKDKPCPIVGPKYDICAIN